MKKILKLTVFGARGSMPGEGQNFSVYGGSTSCYRVEAGNEEIYLDAGSGIAGVKPKDDTNISVLLTHMHLDHLIGMPFFSALTQKERIINIYASAREGLTVKAAFDRLVSVPFWPVGLEDYPSNIIFHDLPLPIDGRRYQFALGGVTVAMTEGTHPGGSTLFRLTYGGKSMVYATDFEHTPARGQKILIDFARNADLLLYDAQYIEGEYEKFRRYGHSTANAGLKIAKAADVKRIMFVHHAPWRKDEEISELERQISTEHNNAVFAKIGDEIIL